MVEERTEGRVKVEYFPASQLGGYETVYEEIVRGTIDLDRSPFRTSYARLSGVCSILRKKFEEPRFCMRL
jgi:TRAP-type C4-dicarboxylate transport system substrate-binding protein